MLVRIMMKQSEQPSVEESNQQFEATPETTNDIGVEKAITQILVASDGSSAKEGFYSEGRQPEFYE